MSFLITRGEKLVPGVSFYAALDAADEYFRYAKMRVNRMTA